MNRFLRYGLVLIACLTGFSASAEEAEGIMLEKVQIDLSDLPALQRGAKLFMNYCSGCHSLKYLRYQTMAQDLGMVDNEGQLLTEAIKEHLLFTGEQLQDPIKSAMPAASAAAWFGVAPPDLSLASRVHGVDWLYSYLRSFYPDPTRPWGVNNRIFPDVAMPDVLSAFRTRLLTQEQGAARYDRAILDLVHFLSYAGEPMQVKRRSLGIWVLLFLGIFCVFACLLKREYWKDIH